MDVLKALSEDILEAICHQLEPPSADENNVLLKHEKNKTVLAVSNVCKSWNWRLMKLCKSLFQDIAFHVSSTESFATARVLLELLEESEVPTYVYAELGHYYHPALAGLFAKIHPRIKHIVHFEYCVSGL